MRPAETLGRRSGDAQQLLSTAPATAPGQPSAKSQVSPAYAGAVAWMSDLVRDHTDLDDDDLVWLQLLMADWQIVADLSFADLVMWLPDRDGRGFWAVAQMRPTTGPTALVDDVVGDFVEAGQRPLLDGALRHRKLLREGDPEWRDDVPVRVESIPVQRGGRVIGVIARSTNLLGVRTPSRLELSYLETASDLTRMIAGGQFPVAGQRSANADSPRVGDGFVRVEADGRVRYASPNALSVFRRLGHRGDLVGVNLADLTRALVPPRRRPDEETLSAVLGGRAHRDTEVATDAVAIILRTIPLRPYGDHVGALILLRDVTDLRRRDRELVTKDATIREIHHRVKNNLQTVAALLRLQARRIDEPAARAALGEAVRRVGSIAIVHETLSQVVEENVDFDQVAERLLRMVVDVSAAGERISVRATGAFGTIPSEVATPLAMVVTELLQNAVEHGFGALDDPEASGAVTADAQRVDGRLRVVVEDDGRGLPPGFDLDGGSGLGLTIVRTLVESELRGRLAHGRREYGPGSRFVVDVPVEQ